MVGGPTSHTYIILCICLSRRFVYLEDCKHTVESRGLEQWINQNSEEIAMKQCPICKMSILKTLRFKNHVKTVHKDICEIGKKLFGGHSSRDIDKKKVALKWSVNKLHDQFADVERTSTRFANVKKLWDRSSEVMLQRLRKITLGTTPVVDLDSWTSVARLSKSFFSYETRIRDMADGGAKDAVVDHFVWLLSTVIVYANRLSRQQTTDVNLEMARGARLVSLAEVKSSADYAYAIAAQSSASSTAPETVGDWVMRADAFLTATEPYNLNADSEVQRLIDRARAAVKGLVAVTNAERKMIHAAMSVSFNGRARSQGHWLKCCNGHIYCVTECGGPMEKSKCPVCKVDIGGTDHRYVEGTTVATEMDGASHVAWSAANDMNNFFIE